MESAIIIIIIVLWPEALFSSPWKIKGTSESVVWCNHFGVMRLWNISPTIHKQVCFICVTWELKVHPAMSYFTDQKEHMCNPPGGIITLLNLKGENEWTHQPGSRNGLTSPDWRGAWATYLISGLPTFSSYCPCPTEKAHGLFFTAEELALSQ